MAVHIDLQRKGRPWNETRAPADSEEAQINQIARKRPELALAMAVILYDSCLCSASKLAARGKRMRELADIVVAREQAKTKTPSSP